MTCRFQVNQLKNAFNTANLHDFNGEICVAYTYKTELFGLLPCPRLRLPKYFNKLTHIILFSFPESDEGNNESTYRDQFPCASSSAR